MGSGDAERRALRRREGAADVRGREHPLTPPAYIVAPSTHGANSAAPKSKLSLLVRPPLAVSSIFWKIRSPTCCTVSSPVTTVPQLMSMSSSIRWYIGVLVASLMEGVGLQPKTLPRPVVKQSRLAPPATWPVAPTGS